MITGPAYLTHLFLEQSDQTIARVATDILSFKPECDIDSLLSQIKATEAPKWKQIWQGC